MLGIIFILIAGALAATANFFLRKSIDAGGSSKVYLAVQLGISFFVAVLLNPVSSGQYSWSTPVAAIGLVGGLILGLMMLTLGKSLQYGPPGLTFAILNSSSVMPAILMALLFGSIYGHEYTIWNAIGSVMVILGLFWAGWQVCQTKGIKFWLFLAFGAFALHTAFLLFMQWRAMLLKPELPDNILLSFRFEESVSQWFMPMIFLAATIVQIIVYVTSEKRLPKSSEVLYGLAGGIAMGICTYFLVKATEVATAFENAMLFPIYSVVIVFLCNAWGQVIYKEKVNWAANLVCLAGLGCGAIDWTAISSLAAK